MRVVRVSRIPPAVIEAVAQRRLGTCEATGWPWGTVEHHHRKARHMGGTGGKGEDLDTLDNIVGLCPRHHRWAHAHPDEARRRGLIVRSREDPADVPVRPDPRLGRCSVLG